MGGDKIIISDSLGGGGGCRGGQKVGKREEKQGRMQI